MTMSLQQLLTLFVALFTLYSPPSFTTRPEETGICGLHQRFGCAAAVRVGWRSAVRCAGRERVIAERHRWHRSDDRRPPDHAGNRQTRQN